jgi:hypothetical protein
MAGDDGEMPAIAAWRSASGTRTAQTVRLATRNPPPFAPVRA